jgi:hypothetical protein
VRIEDTAVDLEAELEVETGGVEPAVAPNEVDSGLARCRDAALHERATDTPPANVGKRRHAAKAPGGNALSSGTGLREERGDGDEAVAVEGAEMERRRQVLFGELRVALGASRAQNRPADRPRERGVDPADLDQRPTFTTSAPAVSPAAQPTKRP